MWLTVLCIVRLKPVCNEDPCVKIACLPLELHYLLYAVILNIQCVWFIWLFHLAFQPLRFIFWPRVFNIWLFAFTITLIILTNSTSMLIPFPQMFVFIWFYMLTGSSLRLAIPYLILIAISYKDKMTLNIIITRSLNTWHSAQVHCCLWYTGGKPFWM